MSRRHDIGSWSRQRRLPQEEVIRYAVQVCRVLEYLHSQPRPVMHQDIKPANLILERAAGRCAPGGLWHGGRATRRPASSPRRREQASVYGTDGYAPPEQYRGQPAPRSDVFALAATTYHLLTDDDPREHPFKWPRLARLPRELSLALQRALRPDPEHRSTANELREALETFSTPSRALEAFTFPGNAQIKTVGALPALCDEHWDAARRFLYNGDFPRWLRDLNRHDLVLSAEELLASPGEPGRRPGGFPACGGPRLAPTQRFVVDPLKVDLGSIARESALIRRVHGASTVTRGYVLAQVTSVRPLFWLEDLSGSSLHLLGR